MTMDIQTSSHQNLRNTRYCHANFWCCEYPFWHLYNGLAISSKRRGTNFWNESVLDPAHGEVWVGLTITMLGTAIVSWIFSSDVLFVPTIAKEMPSLFDKIFSVV